MHLPICSFFRTTFTRVSHGLGIRFYFILRFIHVYYSPSRNTGTAQSSHHFWRFACLILSTFCMPRICGQTANYALACQPVPMSTNPTLPGSIPAELGNLGALSILRLQNKQLTVELLYEPHRWIAGRKCVIPYQQSIVWCPCVSQAGRFRTPLIYPRWLQCQ